MAMIIPLLLALALLGFRKLLRISIVRWQFRVIRRISLSRISSSFIIILVRCLCILFLVLLIITKVIFMARSIYANTPTSRSFSNKYTDERAKEVVNDHLVSQGGSPMYSSYSTDPAATENSAISVDSSGSTESYDFGSLSGFLTSIGEQNAMDRAFNAAEAVKQREWQEDMLQAQMDYNSAEASANREWQSKESQLSRDWQQMMSDTSYQRAVSDLRKAGLNPILAAQRAGASTGSGGMATGGSAASVAPVSGASASSSGSRGVDLTQILSSLGSLLSGTGDLVGGILSTFKGKSKSIGFLR